MKKICLLLLLAISLNAYSQRIQDLVLYIGNGTDSAQIPGNINGITRRLYAVDLFRATAAKKINYTDTSTLVATQWYVLQHTSNSAVDTTQITNFFIKARASLATVAVTGDYNDLSNKPSIPAAQVNSDWNAVSGLALILNKPVIPTNNNQLTNGSNYLSSIDTGNINNFFLKVRAGLSTVAISGVYNDLTGKPSLATVATTGAYNDLTGKPIIPAAQVNTDWLSSSGVSQLLNKPVYLDSFSLTTRKMTSKVEDSTNASINALTTIVSGKQTQLSGTGFVKATGTTISYDNSTYLTSVDSSSIPNFFTKVRASLQTYAYSNLPAGILKGNGAGTLSAAVAIDFPTLNQNTIGSAASISTNNVITNANLTNMNAHTIKGNNTPGATSPSDLTATQVTAELNTFTSTLKGLVPAPGSVNNFFLRDDGTWTSTPSGFSNPMTTRGDIIFENVSPAPARLAGPTSSTKQFLTSTGTGTLPQDPAWGTIAIGDVPTLNQSTTGTASNITGVLNAASFPALTGDVTTVSGALGTTLATVNANVFGSNTLLKITVNGKGLITGAASVVAGDIPNLAESQITNLTTDLGNKQPITTAVTGLTAAGSTQGTGLVLSGVNTLQEVTTAAAGTGVVLPTPTTSAQVVVVNRGANAIIVYPASGHAINGQSANLGYTLSPGAVGTFIGKSASAWYTENAITGGDVNTTDANGALILSTVNGNVGTWNNVTVNGKGLVTAGSNVAYLTTAVTSVATGWGTSGGTIIATGTIIADSFNVDSRLWRQKLADSINAVKPDATNAISIGGINFAIGGPGTQRTWSLGVGLPGVIAKMTAASSAINTTETALLSSPTIAANQLTAGSTYRIVLYGTCTSSVANASNFRVRIGTAGTVSDAVVGVVTPTAAASGTTVPFKVTFLCTVRTTGSSGTMAGEGDLDNNGVTGVSAATPVIGTVSSITVNTTVGNIISVWYVSAASTTTSTFQIGTIECVKI